MATASRAYDGVAKGPNKGDWTWTHPELGVFTYNSISYFGDWQTSPPTPGTLEIAFHLDRKFKENDFNHETTKPPRPPDHLVAEALRVKALLQANNRDIERQLAKKLWDEWHGRVSSCMWWSCDMNEVKENWECDCPGEPFPNGPRDMEPLTKITTLRVFDKGSVADGMGFEGPYWLDFEVSKFEPEHGLGAHMLKGDTIDCLSYSFTAM